MTMTALDWIGFIGVTILLLAYFLNLKDILNRNNILYVVMNLLGASLACIASVLLKYMPFIILEGCWVLVSLFELMRYFKRTSKQ